MMYGSHISQTLCPPDDFSIRQDALYFILVLWSMSQNSDRLEGEVGQIAALTESIQIFL